MKANGIDTSGIVITKEDILSGKIFTKHQLMDSIIRLSANLDKAIEALMAISKVRDSLSSETTYVEKVVNRARKTLEEIK